MFDIRRVQVHSLKEFFKEFAMIVIGILTAIAIEHQYTKVHKRHEAELATQRIRAEIASNLKSVEESIAANRQALQTINEVERQVLSDIRSGLPQSKVAALLEKHMDGHYGIGASSIDPAQDAWDAAIASQAVAHMPSEELHTFSKLYAHQRSLVERQSAFKRGISDVLHPRWNALVTDLELHQVNPVEFLKALREFQQRLTNLNQAQSDYAAALKASGHSEPA
ncbi:hypothetical protein KSF73_01020 [Burkholderiaceae bacterium DAT-1]|nr:hypothetical protein [Burkholderiaceae bacterium DAT-1]